MAQTSKYVAELLLKLQADKALTEARKQMKDLLGEAQKTEVALKDMLESLSNKYGIKVNLDAGADDLKNEVSRVAAELQKAGKGIGVPFTEATDDAIRLGQATMDAAEATAYAENGAWDVAEANEAAAKASEAYANAAEQAGARAANAHVKTTLASQNVIRIIQDMPYGMMGITNNIQSLGDSMGYLMQQTEKVRDVSGQMVEKQITAGRALQLTLKGLFTGPMALSLLVALATVIIQEWDKILSMFDKVREMLGLITAEQRALNDALRDMSSEAEEAFENRYVAALEKVTDESLPALRSGLVDTLADLQAQKSAIEEGISPAMREAAEASKPFVAIINGMAVTSIPKVNEETQKLAGQMAAINAELAPVEEKMERLTTTLQLVNTREGMKLVADGAVAELTAMGGEVDSVGSKVEGLFNKIRQMRIDMMDDTIEKVRAQVELDFDEMIAGFDPNAAGYTQAVATALELRNRTLEEKEQEFYDEQRDTLIEALDERLTLQQQRIAAERAVGQARISSIENEYKRERGMARTALAARESEIAAEIAIREEQRQQYEEGTDEYQRLTYQINALEAERAQTRVETERTIKESFRNEDQAANEHLQRQKDIMYQLLQEEEAIATRRAQLATGGGALNIGATLDLVRARQRQQETQELILHEQNMQNIRERFANDKALMDDMLEREHQNHMDSMEAIEKESQQSRIQAWSAFAQQVSQMAASSISQFAQTAQINYETWKQVRSRELDEMGVSEQEKAAILEKEGAKAFEHQKKLQIAAAWAQGLSGMVGAVSSTAGMGPIGWALGAAQAASIFALTKANVRRIKSLRPDGGGVAGGAGASAATGSYAALNGYVTNDRNTAFETWRLGGGFDTTPNNTADRMNEAVDRFENSARNLTATVSPRGQGQIVDNGQQYNNLKNGNA